MKNLLNRHRKLYYTPGLISLIILPILCFWYLIKHQKFDTPRTMEIAVPDKYLDSNKLRKYYADSIKYQREFRDYNISGNDYLDEFELNKSEISIHSLTANMDTINGVHFHFGPQAKYKSFVRILDILKIKKTQIYMLYDNDLWAFMGRPNHSTIINKEYTRPFCGTSDLIIKQLRKEKIEELSITFVHRKSFWASISLFSVLCILSFVRIYKQKSY